MEPIPGARPSRTVQRQAPQPAYLDDQYYQQAPAPETGTVTLSREQMNQLNTIAKEVKVQQDANQRKEAELREKEETLRKGTALLLEQRDATARKEEGLKAREVELRTIAGELEKQARKVAEKEGALAQQRSLFAEEEARRRKFSEGFRAREGAIMQKEAGVKSLENELRLREQALLGMEMDIKECPYCNVRYEFTGIQDMMDEARSFGLDLTELDKKYAKAQEHLKREAYDQALESARGLLKELKTLREDILAKGVQYVVFSAANTIGQAKGRGLDVSAAEDHLAQARASMARNDLRAAEHSAKEAEYLARDLIRQESQAPQPSAVAPGPESPAPPMPPLEPTPQLPPAAAPRVQRRPAPQRQEAPPPMQEPPAQPRYDEPDSGPHYEPAPPPHYESVGDAGPRYESEPQPQYEEPPAYGGPEEQSYQPPAEEPAPAGPRKYSCQSCGSQFTIGTPQRPVKVSCPSCHSMMIIRD
jgi:DNA-directed RNA polymerase subunit RPC12/RpoP